MRNLYSVKDIKGIYMDIFPMVNDEVAKRTFADALNDKNSIIAKHPTDMELYRIGTWDDRKGEITPDKEYLCNGNDYYKGETNNGATNK